MKANRRDQVKTPCFPRREIIDAFTRSDETVEIYSKKTEEVMDKFLQTINDSVGSQLQRTQQQPL